MQDERFCVAMVASEKADLPEWIAGALEQDGIELSCRKCQNEKDLLEVAADADVIWTFGPNLVLTADVLPKLPACRAIFRSGSGVDALPVEAASNLGIYVCNSPESIAESVAEHTVALLFALIRQIPVDTRAVRAGIWQSSECGKSWHISRRVVGLVGFGRIARHVMSMLSGFQMRFLCHDPFVPDAVMHEHGVEPVTLDRLLTESDYISLHCPLVAATHQLIGEAELRKMKPLALLVNTSRGGVIDQKALYQALVEHWIGGVALDVTDPEPLDSDCDLLQLDNVVITPHVAAFSADFEDNFWRCSVDVLRDLRDGLYSKRSVNAARIDACERSNG